jgi:hypothetical protein
MVALSMGALVAFSWGILAFSLRPSGRSMDIRLFLEIHRWPRRLSTLMADTPLLFFTVHNSGFYPKQLENQQFFAIVTLPGLSLRGTNLSFVWWFNNK